MQAIENLGRFDFLFKHRVREPASLKWIGAIAWWLDFLCPVSRSFSDCMCVLAPGSLEHLGCAFRDFLQCLIHAAIHCYHSECMCLCMCELLKTQDPEGLCIPEEFQNHLMTVVVGWEGVRSCSLFRKMCHGAFWLREMACSSSLFGERFCKFPLWNKVEMFNLLPESPRLRAWGLMIKRRENVVKLRKPAITTPPLLHPILSLSWGGCPRNVGALMSALQE